MRVRKLYNDGGEVAKTILQQLGGAGKLNAMTGAYNFMNTGNGLSFRIKNQRANYIKITLTSMDLYDVEVGRVRGGTYKVVKSADGLYADQLKPFIEQATGMYLTLGRGFAKGGMVSVNTEDGEVLQYKLDKDEMSLEVNAATKQYLTDIVLVMDRDFRKLGDDKYIFWYDELSAKDLEELEELLKVSLPVRDYEKGGYVLGNKWSDDFDYRGMLKTALKSEISWGVDKLRKLFDSFEDVNYHTASKNLWEAIQNLKIGNTDEAEQHLEMFHDDVIDELMDTSEPEKPKVDLKDVFYELRSLVRGLSINEERDGYIEASVRDWGMWEHDYDDYERDEDDFEDDDQMVLSQESYNDMNVIVKKVLQKYPDVKIDWDASEKNWIDFTITPKKMADGGYTSSFSGTPQRRNVLTMADGGEVDFLWHIKFEGSNGKEVEWEGYGKNDFEAERKAVEETNLYDKIDEVVWKETSFKVNDGDYTYLFRYYSPNHIERKYRRGNSPFSDWKEIRLYEYNDAPYYDDLKKWIESYKYSYAYGGEINWGEDLGDGFTVGNDVYVPEFDTTGFLIGKMGNDLIVKIYENGEERDEVVSKKGIKKLDAPEFAKGGKVKKRVRFVDKVDSIADRLDGTKVPKRLKKDYGGRYNRIEAEEAGRRIAGAQLRDRKN